MEVIYCTCFFSKCGSSTSARAHSHGHEGMETSLHTRFCIVNPHKCESEILHVEMNERSKGWDTGHLSISGTLCESQKTWKTSRPAP